MKLALIVSMFFLPCSLHADSARNLAIYGVINDVKTTKEDVSIVFTGIAGLNLNDPSLKEPVQYFSLSHMVIHLKFDNGFKGMHTYSRFRYLDWINEEQAIFILKECQKKSTEIRMIFDAESLTYSRTANGALRVSSLTGTIWEVAPWVNLEKESLSDHLKMYMGVRYDLVPGVKPDAEPVVPSDGGKKNDTRGEQVVPPNGP